MRLYLSGPMTGLPEFNYPAFHAAEAHLRGRGYDVINPARWGAIPGWTWREYMRQAVRDVADAEGLAMLPNWLQSRGANVEFDLAKSLGLPARAVHRGEAR